MKKLPKPSSRGYQFIRPRQPAINALVPARRNEYIVPVRSAVGGGAPPGWTNPFPTGDWELANRGDGLGNMTP